jgi:membrane protein DedA with SNARE-associated domain
MDLLQDGINAIGPFVRSYGLVALFCLIYFESLGLPLPGETALIGAVALAYEGQLPITGVFIVVVIAAILGDNTGYLIGRHGGRPLMQRFGKVVGLTPERQAWIERLYETRGAIIVAGARFVVVLRQLNGVVAGSMKMAWPVFLVANILGALLWTAAWTFGPFLAGHLVSLLR